MAGPAGVPTQVAFSQSTRWPSLDEDRAEGCIRSTSTPFSKEGGLAVLTGNIALNGCVVRPQAWMTACWCLKAPPWVESRDEAVEHPWPTRSRRAMWSSCATKALGRPGMRKCCTPPATSRVKGQGKACALLTDGRFSSGTSGLSSATPRPKPPLAAPLAGAQTTASASTSPTAASTCWCLTKTGPAPRAEQDAKGWKPRSRATGHRAQGLRQAGHVGRQGRCARPVVAGRLGVPRRSWSSHRHPRCGAPRWPGWMR